MAAPFRITLVKVSPYNGAPEKWANDYDFAGTTPADPAAWLAFAEALWAVESNFIQAFAVQTYLVHAYGYAPGQKVNSWSYDFTAGGESNGLGPDGGVYAETGGTGAPMSVCALGRWLTGEYSKKGRPTYLYKFWHDVWISGATPDKLNIGSPGAGSIMAQFTNATLPGAAVLATPDGTPVPNTGILKIYSTTHQLKRRGKRPKKG
jgi:hypothetical protein